MVLFQISFYDMSGKGQLRERQATDAASYLVPRATECLELFAKATISADVVLLSDLSNGDQDS